MCAVFLIVLCGLYFVPSSAWHRLEPVVYSALRTGGPVFRASCLPDGPPPSRVNITVVTLHHEKDELYEVRIDKAAALLRGRILGWGGGGVR